MKARIEIEIEVGHMPHVAVQIAVAELSKNRSVAGLPVLFCSRSNRGGGGVHGGKSRLAVRVRGGASALWKAGGIQDPR